MVPEDTAKAFRAKKNMWSNFAVIPVMGWLKGIYAAFFQKKGMPILAIACLLPLIVYELATEPVQIWSIRADVQYFGMRGVEVLLAIISSLSVCSWLDSRTLGRK